jgi:hypothetical protein
VAAADLNNNIIIFNAAGSSSQDSVRIKRGDAVAKIVNAFNLEQKNKNFITDCLKHPDECFFAFSAMSDFDWIKFRPLILYPDVFPAHSYYGAVNVATMLGLVHGYINEEYSPFKPEEPMTRIQALKVILGAANLLPWKEKFELEGEMANSGGDESVLPFKDLSSDPEQSWWYRRYAGYALEAGIIESNEFFRPNQTVTEKELAEMIEKTLAYGKLNSDDQETVASANPKK